MDSTASLKKLEAIVLEKKSKKFRVGIIKQYLAHKGMNPEVRAKLEDLVAKLKLDGHVIVELDFPVLDQMVPTYYVLSTAEASSNLSRFDGVHYGYQSPNAKGIEETYKKSRAEGFGVEVKRRIMAGTFVLSHGYYDAYYTKGQKVRRVIRDRTNDFYQYVDCILTPTTPSVAFPIDGLKDPIEMYLQDIFTVHANLSGHPAISLPLGENEEGLPFGVQVMTKKFDEQTLFDFSRTLEDLNA